jgi:hypothetical protein
MIPIEQRACPDRAGALEAYVTDALGPTASAEVEDHVRSCPGCAEALVREAQLERGLPLVAAAILGPRRPARIGCWIGATATAMAAGALALLLAFPRGSLPPEAPATPAADGERTALTCVGGVLAVGCEREAARHGLWIQDGSGAVPVYESYLARQLGAAPVPLLARPTGFGF